MPNLQTGRTSPPAVFSASPRSTAKTKYSPRSPAPAHGEPANSLAFKLPTANAGIQSRLEKDPRVGYTLMGKTRWFTFELSSDSDLHGALDWIGEAYTATGKKMDKTDKNVAKKKVKKKSR